MKSFLFCFKGVSTFLVATTKKYWAVFLSGTVEQVGKNMNFCCFSYSLIFPSREGTIAIAQVKVKPYERKTRESIRLVVS